MNLDILIIALEMIVPFVILIICAKRKDTIERNRRNRIINEFKFEEFNTWEEQNFMKNNKKDKFEHRLM